MVQIIQENRKPSFLERVIPALSQGLDSLSPILERNRAESSRSKEASALSELTGMDLSDLSPENLSHFAKEFATQLRPQSKGDDKEAKKNAQSIAGLQGAMDVVNRMRSLREKGNLGFGSSVLGMFNPDTRQDSGEYEQLGKSLIQYATNIPIRNKLEFETLAHSLYDPTITDAKAKGVLDSMERIINNSLSQYEMTGESSAPRQQPTQKKPSRPLGSFAK